MIAPTLRMIFCSAPFLMASAGSSTLSQAPKKTTPSKSQWQVEATEADQKRLDQWEEALEIGVKGAQVGEGDELAARSPLFKKSAALRESKIPAGLYACSITKLDGDPDGSLPYIAYPAFQCRVTVDAGRRHFTKLTGSQRTIGWIYDAGPRHSVYLGSLIYGYEDKLISYGTTAERDQAAVVQRIGKKRWRMVFPYPYYESKVDVMELTPITE
ncbi:MAG: DUF4893 domain-containing protein [Parasphingorhabdus sp.]|uniref:DUF4893 domain-containing protein n=1 Tax=Parasphingorhabdus sp. TaxID=2709688 RepID=UPI00300141FD